MLKRKVFYIPGFDPRSESHYKKLLLNEFPEIKGLIVEQQKNRVVFNVNEMQVDYEILGWHEQVKNHWLSGFFGNVINVTTLFWEFVFKGAYWRGSKFTKRDAIQKAFSVYWFTFWLVASSLLLLGLLKVFDTSNNLIIYPIVFLVWFGINLALYKFLDRLHIFWVTRVMRFFTLYAQQKADDVLKKEQEFIKKIVAALQNSEFDEVILVGHSVGTILTLNMMVELEKIIDTSQLKVITLGHCVTGVTVLKEAGWFNDRLYALKDRKLFWLDVTSGKDAVNFYKVNPAYHKEAEPDMTVSAGFHQIFDREFYKSLKYDFYKIHFLYLYKPHFPDKSFFNYEKLLFSAKYIARLQKS